MVTFNARDLAPLVIGAALTMSVMTGTAAAQITPPYHGYSGPPIEITVPATPNDLCETYYFSGPALVPPEGAPLLVIFHSAYHHHDEYTTPKWDSYDLITEAQNRGWFVMMQDGGQLDAACTLPAHTSCPHPPEPTGGIYTTFGTDPFHRHTEAAIRDAVQRFPINPDRIYGYGFSMGGLEALSYAARHLDPTSDEGMLAAVISSSGYVSPIHEDICNNFIYDCAYGRPGTSNFWPFCDAAITPLVRYAWKRAGVMTLNCNASCVPAQAFTDVTHWDSQVQNIATLPIRLCYEMHEDLEVIESNDTLNVLLGGNAVQVSDCSNPTLCGSVLRPDCSPSNHQWSTVCAEDALAFLDPNTLKARLSSMAGSGSVLCAENDRRYLHFRVKRTNLNDFGRIQWSTQTNKITLENLTMPSGFTPNVNEIVFVGDNPALGADDPLSVLDTRIPVKLRTAYSVTTLGVSGYETGAPSNVDFFDGTTHTSLAKTFSGDTVRFSGLGVGTYTITP